jgi:hypothetical protein
MTDKTNKGRTRNGGGKLLPFIKEIKEALKAYQYGDLSRLARKYGTTPSQIQRIRDGRVWSSI